VAFTLVLNFRLHATKRDFVSSNATFHDHLLQVNATNDAGPVFGDLDPELIKQFQLYLEQRGLDKSLAAFIPQYLEFKEQKEYMAWLKNVSAFVAKQ
jgi:hypothetical protein